jgi:uncharacterized protein (DUF433 family)
MQLEDYFDFLVDPYAIRIKGRRIGLEHVVERYKEGQTAEQIGQYFDDLPLESIYAAILYYLHFKDTVEDYLADIAEFDREQRQIWAANPSPASLRMRALFEQLRKPAEA